MQNTCEYGIIAQTKYVARLAQSVEHETLNLRVVGSSPTLGDKNFVSHPRTFADFYPLQLPQRV